jgi:hypothetical protein
MLIAGSVIIGRREGEDAKRKTEGVEKEKGEVGDAGDGSVASGADVSCFSSSFWKIVDFEIYGDRLTL